MSWTILILGLAAAAVVTAQTPRTQRAPNELSRAAEEFKVLTRNMGLRQDSPASTKRNGQSAGASWHGRVFEYFRNDFLDAVPHEITQRGGTKSLLRRNQFGFNLSGPVVIPKLFHGGRNTFFSVSYEGVRERIARSFLRTIPTLPERTGDFSALVDQAGEPLPVYDPQTTRPNPAYDPSQPVSPGNLQYVREPFPGNRVPASRLDPVAQKALAYYPAPNSDAGPFFRNNYFVVSPETNNADGMIFRVDHTMNEKHRFAGGGSFSNGFNGNAQFFPTPASPSSSDRDYESRRAYVEHVLTLSARSLNTMTFEGSSSVSEYVAEDLGGDYAGKTGLEGVSAVSFPNFRISPYLSMGRASPAQKHARNTFVLSDSFSSRRGKHSLRASGYIARYQVNSLAPQYPSGSFRFTPDLTSLPGIVNTGHGFASFVLGLPDYAEMSLVDSPSYFRRTSYRISGRDHYEITKGFSMELGCGIEVSTPRTEKFDHQSTVDLSMARPSGEQGALVAASRDGQGRTFQPAMVSLEPSASIAWNPGGDPKTVVRAAYSRSYSAVPIYSVQWGTQGFTGAPTYISPNVQLVPALTLAGGVPAAGAIPDLRPEAADNTVADLIERSGRQATYQSASLSIERALPAQFILTLGAGISGGRNLFLGNSSANPNAIAPEALVYRDRLNDEVFNRSLRPYPQYKGFDVYSSYPLGRYERTATYVRAEKRASQGLTLSATYEFARQMDDYSGPYGTQDFYNRKNEWSLTSGYTPHRVSMSYAYELPIGSAKPFLSLAGWKKYLVDGWSVSGTTSVASGDPIALVPQFNNTGGVITALRVNVMPGVDASTPDPGPNQWFNPAAFDQPADFTMGDASRTHSSLRNPGSQNHDLSISKRVMLAADRTLEISAVGFNFLNHGIWNDPDAVIGPASAPNVNAGRIIGSRGGRVVQLGMRFSF